MNLLSWHISAWEDYQYWQRTDKAVFKKLNSIIKDTLRNPFSGLGKPEPLVGDYKGYWSKRINREHRLIYFVKDDGLIIISCRYHY